MKVERQIAGSHDYVEGRKSKRIDVLITEERVLITPSPRDYRESQTINIPIEVARELGKFLMDYLPSKEV